MSAIQVGRTVAESSIALERMPKPGISVQECMLLCDTCRLFDIQRVATHHHYYCWDTIKQARSSCSFCRFLYYATLLHSEGLFLGRIDPDVHGYTWLRMTAIRTAEITESTEPSSSRGLDICGLRLDLMEKGHRPPKLQLRGIRP
jgi:hypothetical protein